MAAFPWGWENRTPAAEALKPRACVAAVPSAGRAPIGERRVAFGIAKYRGLWLDDAVKGQTLDRFTAHA